MITTIQMLFLLQIILLARTRRGGGGGDGPHQADRVLRQLLLLRRRPHGHDLPGARELGLHGDLGQAGDGRNELWTTRRALARQSRLDETKPHGAQK